MLPNRFGAFVYYVFEIAVNASGSIFLHARHNVRVKIHRDPDLGVSQALARDLGMNARFQQMRRVRVP